MRRIIVTVTLLIIAGLALVYATGADQIVQLWALEGQRAAQTGIAQALRALRAGEPAALIGVLTVCFAYGFFHAVGPGHGKLLIGGYGVAARIGAVRLSLVALVSSLAQAATAIALVGAGLWLWGWGRAQMTDLAEQVFVPLSFAAIAAIGLWLAGRGLRSMRRAAAHGPMQDADTPQACTTCGHAHAPTPDDLARATSWRDVAALIAAVALRPCTGALFLLILTAQMGIFQIGVAGTLAMALGTASVTVAVALTSVTLRRGALAGLTEWGALARAQPAIEIGVGALIAVIAGQLALAAL
ncbi:MAG: hypothetical protein AAF376_10145 [Pseudomonadota bacterium]